MKKHLLVFASLLIICSLAYITFFNQSQASNNSHKYEYYYNNNSNSSHEGTTTMKDQSKDTANKLSTSDKENKLILPTKIDTDPTSVTVLINKEYTLPADYVPEQLVVPNISFCTEKFEEKKLMRKDAAIAIEELFQAASDKDLSLCGVSGYRSYARQKEIYHDNIRTKGYTYTNLISAKPGSSEHQSGLAMDVSTPSINNILEESFFDTPEGTWLAKNAHKYGFVIRYPKDKSDITGYSYEPWHIRYVGYDVATYLYKNKLTLEEFYHYKPSKDFVNDNDYGVSIDVEDSSEITIKPKTSPSPTSSPSTTGSPTPSPAPATKGPEKTAAPAEEEPDEPETTPKVTKTPTPTETPEPEATPEPTTTPDSSIISVPTSAPLEP